MTEGATAPAQGGRGGGGGGQRHPAAAPLGNLEEGFLPCYDLFLEESLNDFLPGTELHYWLLLAADPDVSLASK